jgi:TatD DNase family protein
MIGLIVNNNSYWIDSHAHLDLMREQVGDVDISGVGGVLTISTRKEHATTLREFVTHGTPWVYRTIGIHPGNVSEDDLGGVDWMNTEASDPSVVAIGEIGLDIEVEHSMELQRKIFGLQLAKSIELDLPVIVHMRGTETEVLEKIERYPNARGVLHSFNGSLDTALKAISHGWYVSFSGMVTFKKSHQLRAVAAEVPGDRMLIETDTPYLSPEPVRGTKNKPGNVQHTAAVLAQVRNTSVEVIRQQTCDNALRLFNKIHPAR